MTVQCDSFEPTAELRAIQVALFDLGFLRFRLELTWAIESDSMAVHVITIKLPKLDGSYSSQVV